MRLFWQEMKKIWRPGILAAIVLIGGMFYWVRPLFYVESIVEAYSMAPINILEELLQHCGPTVDRSELPILQEIIDREKAVFAGFLAEDPDAVKAGVTTWDELEAYVEKSGDRTLQYWAQRRGKTNWWNIYYLEHFREQCEMVNERSQSDAHYFEKYPPQWQQRILELEEHRIEEGLSLLYVFDTGCIQLYFADYLPMSNIFCVILLLSPVLVRDRLRRMRSLQWSSRRGRKVLHTQLAAGFVSAGLLIAVNTAVYTAVMLSTGITVLWDCPLRGYNWFGWTLGEYIMVLIVLAALMGLAAAGLTLFLSYHSGNYVATLFKAIILYLAVGWWFVTMMMEFSPFGTLWPYGLAEWIFIPPAAVPVCTGLLLAAGLSLCLWTCARQKKKELL